jgi:hypothetical protein
MSDNGDDNPYAQSSTTPTTEPPKDFGPDSDDDLKVVTPSAAVEEDNPYL